MTVFGMKGFQTKSRGTEQADMGNEQRICGQASGIEQTGLIGMLMFQSFLVIISLYRRIRAALQQRRMNWRGTS